MSQQIQRLGIFIGGMRCGSTAINDYMKQHPEICVHRKKDPHFFSSNDNWSAGWEQYLKGWSHYDPVQHRIAFESSTHYTKYPVFKETASRIATAPYDVRLIYGVRGPLARIESHFVHNAGKGYYDPNNSEEREKLLHQAINVSNYDMQIGQYERYFSTDQILIVKTQDLIESPAEVLECICNFLEVDGTLQFERIPRRPRKFKNDISQIRLTEAERVEAAKGLMEPIAHFEERYGIKIWDGTD